MHFLSLFHHFIFMIRDWGSPSLLCRSDGRGISDYDWGIFFILVTLDLCLLLIHRDLWNSQKCQILFSVNRDLDVFLFSEIRDQNPTPFFKFSSMEKVFKIDLNLQTFFSSIFICIIRGIRLSCLPLNCYYHHISFALKHGVPVSYYVYGNMCAVYVQ